MTNLLEVPIDITFRITSVHEKARKKLLQYGRHIGDTVRVVRIAPMGGPLLVEINSRELALGRDIAEKITVEAA